MSHHPEREEKNCLNCGTTVIGRYCHQCGQENIDTRESFWSLMKDFVFDIIHFDGKFIHTIRYIFTRPGLVAREYAKGKRATFLHPIRMYLFTSAVFFLIFFALGNESGFFKVKSGDAKLSQQDRQDMAAQISDSLAHHPGDTTLLRSLSILTDSARPVTNSDVRTILKNRAPRITSKSYATVNEYDSAQRSLPASKRDGWFSSSVQKKLIGINTKYKDHPEDVAGSLGEIFLHRLPYLLFLSLPFFALILKLLYIRRKNFYYSDHATFTLYHYILSFILLLLAMFIKELRDWLGWYPLRYLELGIMLSWPVYLILEMKTFYRQGWMKTVAKFFLLNILGMLVLFLLFVLFLFLSILQL
ncbi:MAG: DUF3667 domain-containing protein [Flavisolibacter sp.]